MNKVISFTVSLEGECDICHRPLIENDFTMVDRVEVAATGHTLNFTNTSYHDHCKDKNEKNGPQKL